MTKTHCIQIFGNAAVLAQLIGISKSAISQWPEELPPRLMDRVIAAAVRAGIDTRIFVHHARPPKNYSTPRGTRHETCQSSLEDVISNATNHRK